MQKGAGLNLGTSTHCQNLQLIGSLSADTGVVYPELESLVQLLDLEQIIQLLLACFLI